MAATDNRANVTVKTSSQLRQRSARKPPPPPPPPPRAGKEHRGGAGSSQIDRSTSASTPIPVGRAADITPQQGQRGLSRLTARAILAMLVLIAGAVLAFRPARHLFVSEASAQRISRAVAACGAAPPAPAAPETYERAAKVIDRSTDYRAVIYTSCGDFQLDLLEERAPHAVNNFVFLAREGFYNGLTWDYVAYDSIMQAGDPNARNGVLPDGPGYTIKDDAPSRRRDFSYGAIGMAKTDHPNSAGSQFFVVVHALEAALEGKPKPVKINGTYTVFARVDQQFFGSVENIARQETAASDDPTEARRPSLPIYIEAIQITENG